MKLEQIELMKVIEFPKCKIEEKENRERQDKLEVAKNLVNRLVDEEIEFHIVLDKESILKVLEDANYKDYNIITTNQEEAEKMLLKLTQMRNSCLIPIKGDEII